MMVQVKSDVIFCQVEEDDFQQLLQKPFKKYQKNECAKIRELFQKNEGKSNVCIYNNIL